MKQKILLVILLICAIVTGIIVSSVQAQAMSAMSCYCLPSLSEVAAICDYGAREFIGARLVGHKCYYTDCISKYQILCLPVHSPKPLTAYGNFGKHCMGDCQTDF